MSEPQAAMGLAVLPYMDTIISSRKQVVSDYNAAFKGVSIKTLKIREHTQWNFSYYSVVFKNEAQLLRVKHALEQHDIYPRRYFYPSLNTLPYIESTSMPISEAISSTVLCLPLFIGLSKETIQSIAYIVKENL